MKHFINPLRPIKGYFHRRVCAKTTDAHNGLIFQKKEVLVVSYFRRELHETGSTSGMVFKHTRIRECGVCRQAGPRPFVDLMIWRESSIQGQCFRSFRENSQCLSPKPKSHWNDCLLRKMKVKVWRGMSGAQKENWKAIRAAACIWQNNYYGFYYWTDQLVADTYNKKY